MKKRNFQNLILALLIAIVSSVAISLGSEGVPPIADAGLSRYAAQDPVVLDGTGSYDPDSSAPLTYMWQQIAGPSVVITDANTATPTISGFVQASEIQECEFELVVSDGELASLPDTVKVIIVPDFGASTLQQENPPFDSNKPTVIYFGGGNCVIGLEGLDWDASAWNSRANIISFPNGYNPDSGGGARTYYKYADMIIAYLSAVAPDYRQPIQTIGWSTGGMPAIDVGIRLNRVYADVRYAVNRVTHLDANPACRLVKSWPSPQPLQPWDVYWDVYLDTVELFLTSSVDGEQCWIDHYYGVAGYQGEPMPRSDILWVRTRLDHGSVRNWYRNSLTGEDMNNFNSGMVAGAYWSVVGPGKNLQLAWESDAYYLSWDGNEQTGSMSFYDEALHPGRLPEPVMLIGPADGAVVDANGAILSCEESQNSVGYQLLFGSDPYHMVYLLSDTSSPPAQVITSSPFEQTWWTVKVYDKFGSTIYADPIRVNFENLDPPLIKNITIGKGYGSIQLAIDDADSGDEIIVGEGIYQENIDFKGKNIILRSTDPNDPAVVAATVINGVSRCPVVTFSAGEEESCVLEGLTIASDIVGISCRDAFPTIRNCTVGSTGAISIEFWGSAPRLIDCTILGEVVDPALLAHWKLDEIEGDIAYDSAADCDGTLMGDPLWQPDGGMVAGALQLDGIDDYVETPFVLDPAFGAFSVFAWIKGGAPGQVVLSQTAASNWLSTDSVEGYLITELQAAGRVPAGPLLSQTVITDGEWHRIGLVWDGSYRHLYIGGAEVAKDAAPLSGMKTADNGLHFGVGGTLAAGTFFSGLIDDVRIYNRVVRP